MPRPSFFEEWDSTVVARVGFLADSCIASFIECTDDPITHPFRKVREKNGATGGHEEQYETLHAGIVR
jgi:hypothetical protein